MYRWIFEFVDRFLLFLVTLERTAVRLRSSVKPKELVFQFWSRLRLGEVERACAWCTKWKISSLLSDVRTSLFELMHANHSA